MLTHLESDIQRTSRNEEDLKVIHEQWKIGATIAFSLICNLKFNFN